MNHIDLYKDPNKIDWKTPVVIDFETYYDKEYSLSKITMEKYIRCDKFECIGVAVKIGNNPTHFYKGETGIGIIRHIVTTTYPNSPVAMQNGAFDAGILAFRYGIHPNFMVDTMVMAKLSGFDRVAGGTSLAKMSAQLEKMGIFSQVKGNEVHNMLGVHASDMTPQQWQAYGDYCKLDVDLTHALYIYMISKVPTSELIMSDITTKMWTKPMFDIDVPLLEQYAVRLETEREQMLSRISGDLGFDSTDELLKNLRSSKKFVALLESLGVEVPMKWSEKQEKMIPAVSKTDTEFLSLLDHDNELVRSLVETKLGTMSSMEQTRTATFLDIASRGLMPLPLRYSGTHTHRFSGMDSLNVQNLAKRTKDPVLRRSMRAMDGHIVLASDSGQIECLAGDGLVLTNNGLKQIVNISIDDLLWDGVEYVSHNGVIFKGVKDVITYSGITATPEHIVFTTDGRKITLDEAAAERAEILVGERAGQPVRAVGYTEQTYTLRRDDTLMGEMYLRCGKTSVLARCETWQKQELQSVQQSQVLAYTEKASQSTTNSVQLFGRALQSKQVFQPYLQRCGEQVRKLRAVCELCLGQFPYGRLSWVGDRPSEYERSLRTKQYPISYKRAECTNTKSQYNGRVYGRANERKQICKGLYTKLSQRLGVRPSSFGIDGRTDSTKIPKKKQANGFLSGYYVFQNRFFQKVQQWASKNKSFVQGSEQRFTERDNLITGTIPVYDIVNAGVRNRFCYNGMIVSNCRINALMSNQQDLTQLFLDGRDPYVDMATAIFNKSYDEIIHEAKVVGSKEGKKMRNLGKEAVLACGFGMSANTFRYRMELTGNLEAAEMADEIVQAYRNKNNMLVAFWRECQQVLDVLYAGGSMWFGGVNNDLFFADGSSEFYGKKIPSIRLPNGAYIFYQNLRKEAGDDGKVNYVYDQFKGRNWLPKRIWGSSLVENLCIAEDTLVLTDSGWKKIQDITTKDKVHDGIEFVTHGGLVFKSVKDCVKIDGVYMTKDHEVLTDDGWKTAEVHLSAGATSQLSRFDFSEVWQADCYQGDPFGRKEVALGLPMRVWECCEQASDRCEKDRKKGWNASLWLQHIRSCFKQTKFTRLHTAPNLLDMAEYESSLSKSKPQGLEKLWWQGYNSVRTMVRLSNILSRYVTKLSTGFGFRPQRQQSWVLQGELPLGYTAGKLQQQTQQCTYTGWQRATDGSGVLRALQSQPHNGTLSVITGSNNAPTSGEAECKKAVYDILNCGSRNRFVVKGETAPFVVHNCQALAFVILKWQAVEMAKQGVPINLNVHDEWVSVVPRQQAPQMAVIMYKAMKSVPDYIPQGLLDCELDIGHCYGELKTLDVGRFL